MHEISLIRNLFSLLEGEFPGRIESIREIELSVGLLSNVQPVLIRNAFNAVLQDSPKYKNSSLRVVLLPVLVLCPHCNETTEISNSVFVCSCGMPCRNIIQGEELLIKKVEFAAL